MTVLGASAFVGEAVSARPDLADVALFGEGAVSVVDARRAVQQEIRALKDQRQRPSMHTSVEKSSSVLFGERSGA